MLHTHAQNTHTDTMSDVNTLGFSSNDLYIEALPVLIFHAERAVRRSVKQQQKMSRFYMQVDNMYAQ